MKPTTNGFCALAPPFSPNAAAAAALPSSARRPIENLSIIAVPPNPPEPPAGGSKDGQQGVCQRFAGGFGASLYAIGIDCILFGHQQPVGTQFVCKAHNGSR